MGAANEQRQALWVPIRPIAKQRAVVVNKRGHTPARTREYEEELNDWYEGHRYEHPLGVELVLCPNGFYMYSWPEDCDVIKLRGDVDNYAKAILDGFTGKAWPDDKLVVNLKVRKAKQSEQWEGK